MNKTLSSYRYDFVMDVHTILLYFQNWGSFASEDSNRIRV